MGFEDEAEQSLGRPCRQTNGRSKQTRELTSSIVPRATPFHHSVELEFPPVVICSTSLSCHCGFPGPAELCAVNPDTVQDHGQPSRQRDNRSFHPAPSGRPAAKFWPPPPPPAGQKEISAAPPDSHTPALGDASDSLERTFAPRPFDENPPVP